MSVATLIPTPADINPGVRNARQATMLGLLGNPRGSYDQTCQPVTNQVLAALMESQDVGPFRVTGLRPAVESLRQVMADIAVEEPEVHVVLGTAGMLCARNVRGSQTSISNHSWGTAIDLTLEGRLDPRGDNLVQEGLARIAPVFNRHGWYWGAGFRTEDAMHFECGDDLIRSWHAAGLFGGAGGGQAPPSEMLSLGDRGPDVRWLQERLNEMIGAGLAVDGDFGHATQAAVMALQQANGLAMDGIAGPQTIALLQSAPADA